MFSHAYDTDDEGNITQKGVRTYTYDVLERLNAEAGGTATSFTYDGIGNRLTEVAGGTTTYTYPSTSSKLSSVGANSYTYDAMGNVTGDGVRTYVWSAAGLLKEAKIGGTTVGTYTYSANNQRTKKVAGGTTTHYVYGLGGKIYGEYDNSGVLIREYVWLRGEPLAQIAKSGGTETVTYLHTDHLATPRYGTSAAGSTVWTWDSGAFGKEAPTGTATVNLRFPGQYYDSETTLHYNWNRYYNPVTGRYVSSDPIGLAGGLNTFGYVTQNPLALIDFLGLDTPSFWDQFNPWESFGKRGSIAVVDYREWYQLNFPKTLKHSIGVILDRIAQQICSSPGKKVYPGLKGGGDDVDVDMWTGQHYFEPHPFSDSRYFRLVHFYIGKHSFKTSEIDVTWSSGDRFSFKTLLYALDQKGDNDDSINPTFEYRYWVFAQWNVVGEGCCSKKTINASLTGTFSKTPKGISIP